LSALVAALVYSCSIEKGQEKNQVIGLGEEVNRTINPGTHIILSSISNQWDLFSAGSTVGENLSEFFTLPASNRIFIGDMQTCNETDPSNIRFKTQYVNSDGNTYMWVRTKIEEDNHNGSENNHSRSVVHGNKEVVAGIVMSQGIISSYYNETIGYAGSLDIDLNVPGGDKWNSVSISNNVNIPNPVVFANVITLGDSEPCHVRIKDVQVNSSGNCTFKLSLEEWHRVNSAQVHNTETVNYVVLNKGSYYMGSYDTGWYYLCVDKFQLGLNSAGYGTFKNIDTGKPLAGKNAIVLTNIQTGSSGHPVVTRVKNIPNSTSILKFDVRLQEGKLEAEPQTHGVETVGYMAIYCYNGD
jgi:hypothetical protein